MLSFLRPDLPESYSFSVSQKPYRAKLDQNEAPIDVPGEVKRAIAEELAARPWNRYVQPAEYGEAKAELGEVFGIDPDRLMVTAGADQAIEAAFLLGGGPGRRARWFEPAYPYVAHSAMRTFTVADPVVLGAEVDSAITPALIDAEPRADMIVLVTPNNPTGGLPSDEVVEAALADGDRFVLLDEAYSEFSGVSRIGDLDRYPNLAIARSLSKSLLAGAHIGFLVAHPEAIAIAEQLYTAPYNLNAMQVILARRYRDIAPHVAGVAEQVRSERERIRAALAELDGIAPRAGHANFVLFHVGDGAAALYKELAEAGVRIRNVGGLHGMAGYLRVTVGTSEDNDTFLEAIRNAHGAVQTTEHSGA
jgi:histidinol-phosphate aminotransferase